MNTWPLIAQHQLLKPLQTRSGSFSLLVTLTVWLLLLWYPIRKSAEAMVNSGNAASILNMLGLERLQSWPLPELGAYWALALYLLPAVTLLSAADVFISDRKRGSLRFLLLRSSRLELFTGRLLGLCASQLIVLLVTLTGALMLAAGRLNSLQVFSDHLPIVMLSALQLLLVTLPFISLMLLLSIVLKKTRSATLLAMLIVGLGESVLLWLGDRLPGADWLVYLIPGVQLSEMINQLPQDCWSQLPIPLMQAVLYSACAWFIFRRQAL